MEAHSLKSSGGGCGQRSARRARAEAWFQAHGPVALLVAAIFAAAIVLTVTQWGITYFQDTFAFLLDRQDFTPHSFFMPHNEHIVVLPVAITKLLLAVFGMTSNTPEQVAMALTLFAAAILLFVYVRRRTEAWQALIAATLMLFLGSGWPVLLWPFENEFTLPVVFGIATLLLLDREDGRGDAWACVTLALAVISGSLGISFVVAAFVDLVLKHRSRGWRRAYVFAIPLLIYLAWYAGWGHEAEHHVTLHNILASPAYVMEGFASALDSLAGLSTIPVNSPGANDWGRPLLVGALALAAFAQWRRPGFSRTFWPVAAAALSYWLLAAFNFVPGREASASRYVYAGAIFVLLMVAELLRDWKLNRKALLIVGALAICTIGPNLAQMKEGSDWEKGQSVLTRSDLAAMEIARGTISPRFFLGSVETSGTASLSLVEAEKWFEAVDRWGSPAYSVAELKRAPPVGRHYADLVLSQALPISSEETPGSFASSGAAAGACFTLPGGESAQRDVRIGPGETRVEVAPGPPAAIALRRFATEEFPVAVAGGEGGTTTVLTIPKDRASLPWFVHVEASQTTRVCR